MSTKCTIAHDDDFHLYYECLDEDNVHLRINGVGTLAIPGRIWNQLVAKGQLSSWGGEDFDHPLTKEEREANIGRGIDEFFEKLSNFSQKQNEEDKNPEM